MLKRPDGMWDIDDLDLYFRDCVIGGPGAFMIPVMGEGTVCRSHSDEGRSGDRRHAPSSGPLFQPAQAAERANCLAGELRRQRRMDN